MTSVGRFLRRWWHLSLTAVVVLVVAAVYVVGFSSVLDVRQVSTDGVPKGMKQAVAKQAAVPMGEPLARVDLGAVETRIEELREVRRATAVRKWPHTVELRVQRRQPAMSVTWPQGQLQVADPDGVIFRDVEERPKSLPSVLVKGSEASSKQLRSALQVYRSLASAQRDDVRHITLTEGGELLVDLGDIDVTWGDGSENEKKARVLEVLLAQEETDGAVLTVDVSSPSAPVVKPGS